ncbi:MAG: flagellar biosynthesis protein FlgN, partial [Desulfobacterales bacterium]|nr:flagellar biosynthesis protein FlgN [Desulfobacterales bacterium]
MEETAYKIEELLQEKLSCYRQLGSVLDTEKDAIASIDLDSLWQTARYKKELAARIEGLRAKIIS